LLPSSLIGRVYSYMHMAVNDVAGNGCINVWDILREFLGHNFVSGLRILNVKT